MRFWRCNNLLLFVVVVWVVCVFNKMSQSLNDIQDAGVIEHAQSGTHTVTSECDNTVSFSSCCSSFLNVVSCVSRVVPLVVPMQSNIAMSGVIDEIQEVARTELAQCGSEVVTNPPVREVREAQVGEVSRQGIDLGPLRLVYPKKEAVKWQQFDPYYQSKYDTSKKYFHINRRNFYYDEQKYLQANKYVKSKYQGKYNKQQPGRPGVRLPSNPLPPFVSKVKPKVVKEREVNTVYSAFYGNDEDDPEDEAEREARPKYRMEDFLRVAQGDDGVKLPEIVPKKKERPVLLSLPEVIEPAKRSNLYRAREALRTATAKKEDKVAAVTDSMTSLRVDDVEFRGAYLCVNVDSPMKNNLCIKSNGRLGNAVAQLKELGFDFDFYANMVRQRGYTLMEFFCFRGFVYVGAL